MQYLTYQTAEEAMKADSVAFSFLKQSSNAQGGSWSGVFTNSKDFAVLFDSCIAGAFPEAENIIESEDYVPYLTEAKNENMNEKE